MQNDFRTVAERHQTTGHTLSETAGLGQPLAAELEDLFGGPSDSRYFVRANGHAWADRGIHDGDIAVVDRSLTPEQGSLVITWHAGGFGFCKFWQLLPGDEPVGVVTAIVRAL